MNDLPLDNLKQAKADAKKILLERLSPFVLNPYIKIICDIIKHKRTYDLDTLARLRFCSFASEVWEIKTNSNSGLREACINMGFDVQTTYSEPQIITEMRLEEWIRATLILREQYKEKLLGAIDFFRAFAQAENDFKSFLYGNSLAFIFWKENVIETQYENIDDGARFIRALDKILSFICEKYDVPPDAFLFDYPIEEIYSGDRLKPKSNLMKTLSDVLTYCDGPTDDYEYKYRKKLFKERPFIIEENKAFYKEHEKDEIYNLWDKGFYKDSGLSYDNGSQYFCWKNDEIEIAFTGEFNDRILSKMRMRIMTNFFISDSTDFNPIYDIGESIHEKTRNSKDRG